MEDRKNVKPHRRPLVRPKATHQLRKSFTLDTVLLKSEGAIFIKFSSLTEQYNLFADHFLGLKQHRIWNNATLCRWPCPFKILVKISANFCIMTFLQGTVVFSLYGNIYSASKIKGIEMTLYKGREEETLQNEEETLLYFFLSCRQSFWCRVHCCL